MVKVYRLVSELFLVQTCTLHPNNYQLYRLILAVASCQIGLEPEAFSLAVKLLIFCEIRAKVIGSKRPLWIYK